MIGSLVVRPFRARTWLGRGLGIDEARLRRQARIARDRSRCAVPLYRWLLGDDFDRLPAAIRRFHTTGPAIAARGLAKVTHGETSLVRLLTWLLRFPAAGEARPLRVTVADESGAEWLNRHYPETTLTTRQEAAGSAGSGLLRERFGPFALVFRLEARAHGLSFMLREARCLGLRLPLAFAPRVQARETADDGTYRFFVRVDLPLIGRLIQYQGCLTEIGDG